MCSLCRTHLKKLSVQAPEELPTLVDVPIPSPSTSYLNEELPFLLPLNLLLMTVLFVE